MSNEKNVEGYEKIVSAKEIFQRHIDKLKEDILGIQYIIISTEDGFPVATVNVDVQHAVGRAALTASLEGLCITVAAESKFTNFNSVHIECENGFVFSRNIELSDDCKIVLLTAVSSDENLASVLWHIKEMSSKIQQEFKQTSQSAVTK